MRALEALLTVVVPILTVAVLVGSVAVVGRLDRPRPRLRDRVRSRLVMGVPWGSLVVIGLVLCIYLFVQDGITAFDDPVTIPYRAYSYFYPLGIATASFSHVGPNHLVGNLAGAAVVAPIAEYAWGHYPDDETDESEGGLVASVRTDPWLRALVVFPLAVVAIALVTSLFALGPVIGFSGVVFAFGGFALVHYPIVTVVGILGVQGAVLTVYRALLDPVFVYVAQPSPPSAPSWAGIAIQGHALGFFVGLVLGIALLRRRGHRPDAVRIWIAVLLYGFAKGLWQIYWFGAEDTYLLFRGPGVLLVVVLALVITVAVAGSDRSVVPPRVERTLTRSGRPASGALDRALDLARGASLKSTSTSPERAGRLERITDLASGSRGSSRLPSPGRRRTATALVVVVLAVLAGMAVPFNLFVLEDAASSDTAVEIEDYTIQYAEGVENELVSPVQVGPLAEAVAIESSGVIVASDQRQLWLEAVSANRLAFSGEESVVVGGPGWRETVHVERSGWEPVGNDTVYQVSIGPAGEDGQLAHESPPSRADVRIDDRNVTVTSEDGTFRLEVESTTTGALETTTIPEPGESTTAGGLAFERSGDTIYAVSNGTEVAVASAETYD